MPLVPARQDYSAMYQLLSSESKLKITEADFTERYAKIMQGIEASELGFEMDEVLAED
ncbi:MAG: hypothetical protein EOM70_11820 [Clostridia bacterium]|nr:hypothetical protein [Clostridia bacterium]